MEAIVYNQEGAATGKVKLPESVFGVRWNADLVHQVAVSLAANARTPVAHTKGRGDVRGGGRKPWQQKGTGQARHGSSRSPIWRGGGITHGPTKERNYSAKVNKKMRVRALFAVLSKKLADGEILFVDRLAFAAPKARDAKVVLGALAGAGFPKLVTKKKNAALIALVKKDKNTEKSFRNFGNVSVAEVRNLNVADALAHTYLIIENPSESVASLTARLM